jgi:hypothetical protein
MFIHRLSLSLSLSVCLPSSRPQFKKLLICWSSHPSFVAIVRFCERIQRAIEKYSRIQRLKMDERNCGQFYLLSERKNKLLIWLEPRRPQIFTIFSQTPDFVSLSFSPTPNTPFFFFRSKLHLEATEHACSYFVFLGTVLFPPFLSKQVTPGKYWAWFLFFI